MRLQALRTSRKKRSKAESHLQSGTALEVVSNSVHKQRFVTKRKRDVLFRVLVEISADLHISRRPVSQCATSQLTFLLNTLFRSLIYVTASSESSFFFLFVLPILRVSYR